MTYLKCGNPNCNWIHFQVSKDKAEFSVEEFNNYFDNLSPEEQAEYYHNQKSSIAQYDRCARCGTSHSLAIEAKPEEVPMGSTLPPLIDPNEFYLH